MTNSVTGNEIAFDYERENLPNSQTIGRALTSQQQMSNLYHDSGSGMSTCHNGINAINAFQNLGYFPPYPEIGHLGETQVCNRVLTPAAIDVNNTQHQPDGRVFDGGRYVVPSTVFANPPVDLSATGTDLVPVEAAHNQRKKERNRRGNRVNAKVRVAKKKGKNTVTKHKYSPQQWEQMSDQHINRLRQDGHTSEEIAVVLTVLHGFPTS